MLELKDIKKDYASAGETVHALKGIDLCFRSREFVSILGPSGCGKTTMLNIIGGLDGYTSGDLIINGKSTKQFRDRDWDTYRNHSIGFVFQSYNLIPHQTVLQNVELALTLSGVRGRQRRERAAKALEAVGLGDQLHKRPSEMSGGQMQRVAIARALVNDPEIILLDEPTGALDTETGVMVMEILKKVAADRLIIMVTHNPELAATYSTRIVRMLDGKVIEDSMPLSEEEKERERGLEKVKAEADARKKIPRMLFHTAFGLSLKNLFTKRGRTLLTSMAGSIGIIGIALIYAVSQGTENYIDTVQQDALSSYPLTISSETADMTAMMVALANLNKSSGEGEEGLISEMNVTADVFEGIGTNDLRSFKAHLEDNYSEVEEDVSSVKYSYPVSPLVYTYDVKGELFKVNPSNIMNTMMGGMAGSASLYGSYMSGGLFNEMLDDMELLRSQYDMVAGRWPEKYDEILMVLTDPGHITDFLEYTIGLKDSAELAEMLKKVMTGEATGLELSGEARAYTPEELMDLDMRLLRAPDLYRYNSEFGVWEDMTSDSAYMAQLYEDAERLKIVGIAAPAAGTSAGVLSPGMCYLPELTRHVMQASADAQVVADQLLDRETDVFSGKSFDDLNKQNSGGLDFNNMISVDAKKLSSAFSIKVDEKKVNAFVEQYIDEVMKGVDVDDTSAARADYDSAVSSLADSLVSYILSRSDVKDISSLGADGFSEVAVIGRDECQSIVSSFMQSGAASKIIDKLCSSYDMPREAFDQVLSPVLVNALSSYVTSFPLDHYDLYSKRDELEQLGVELGSGALVGDGSRDEIVYNATSSALGMSVAEQMSRAMTAAGSMDSVRKALQDIPDRLTRLMAGSMRVDSKKIASAFKFNLTEEELTRLMGAYSTQGSKRSYEGNLKDLGYSDPDEPSAITVYLKDFEGKENFIDFIEAYNDEATEAGEDERVIRYTDVTGVLMSSVKTIVDAITYVLIAFVSISLIVSSIMIGVITLISVQERTKEIGILRAIGASKGNVSSMFNAETVIIGFASGLIGVGVTYALCVPINAILHKLTGISTLSAVLPVWVAAALIAISTMLTLFAGIIPSASAAKKDPVVALRTE